jgi:hypothetical protein
MDRASPGRCIKVRQLAGTFKIICLMAMAVLSVSTWATQAPAQVATPCATGFHRENNTCLPDQHCGGDGNQYDFAVGPADYSVGRDVLNNGGGWYVDIGAGEIAFPNDKGEICVQKATRPKAGNAADRNDTPDAPRCGKSVDTSQETEYTNDAGKKDGKDYRMKWMPDSSGQGGTLLITPYVNNRPSSPYLRIKGTQIKGANGKPPQSDLHVTVSTTTPTSKEKTLDFKDSPNGAGGTDPKVCSLGEIKPDGTDNDSWTKQDGLKDPKTDKTVKADTSNVHAITSGTAAR